MYVCIKTVQASQKFSLLPDTHGDLASKNLEVLESSMIEPMNKGFFCALKPPCSSALTSSFQSWAETVCAQMRQIDVTSEEQGRGGEEEGKFHNAKNI